MSDLVDKANAEQEQITNACIALARRQLTTTTANTECIDCGNEIPPQRKQAVPSAVRCVKCQMEHESG